jgi:predicted DsbA family dithiol-disulfide isomerase
VLTLDIVSDVVCPWCWIGTRRLAVAVALIRQDQPDFAVAPRWRPFFLNPDTPPEGEPYLPFLENKFGGAEKVELLFDHVRDAGYPYGLRFEFENIPLRANTLQAHRLIHWAQQRGPADALLERLFQAQFQRGEYVGDKGVLAQIAAECGYPVDEVAAYLATHRDEDTIRAAVAEVQGKGITMVPTFVLPGGEIIVGAEDPRVLAAALRRAAEAR